MTQDELIEQLKNQIIAALSLEDIKPEDIDPDAPAVWRGPWTWTPLDAIELILLLEKNYGIKIEDPRQRKEVLTSVRTMAELVEKEGKA